MKFIRAQFSLLRNRLSLAGLAVFLFGVSAWVLALTAQTITGFAPVTPVIYSQGGTFALSATGGASGNPIVFATTTSTICSVSGATATVLTAGTCHLTANQAGNSTYSAAPQVTANVVISKVAQAITGFTPATPITYSQGTTFNLSANGGASGNPIVFATNSTTVCSVSGSTVNVLGGGTCQLTANQAGNTNYNAAPQVAVNVVITKIAQTITFAALPAVKIDNPPITLVATASSGLPINYTSTTTTVCSLSSGVVTIIGTGNCSVTAAQPGNNAYAAAASVAHTFAVSKYTQAITGFKPASPIVYSNGLAFTLSATPGGSASPLIFATTSPAVCSVTGVTVSVLTPGSCLLTANQAATATYTAAPQVKATVVINKIPQTITFATLPAVSLSSAPFQLTATASSGLSILFSTSTQTVCTVTGNAVTILAAGSCSIAANQPGDSFNAAAPQVTRAFTVNKLPQAITGFAPATPVAYSNNLNFNVSANGGASGNPVLFATTTPTICTVSGNTVSVINVGTCKVTANQAGDATYLAAPQVTANVVISKAAQTINFPVPPNHATADPTFSLVADATSGLPITFAVTTATAANCSVSGATVTLIKNGTCTINATQAGNTFYSAAPTVTQSFTIATVAQTQQVITGFAPATPIVYQSNGTFTLSATGGGSGLPVTFTASPATICTVTGATVKIVGAGNCNLTANQAGNTNFSPAPRVNATVVITKASQTISFGALANKLLSDAPFDVSVNATASSGLQVTFATVTPATCNVSGTTVSVAAVGTCTITADQAGNANYGAAAQQQQSFNVSQSLPNSTQVQAMAVGFAHVCVVTYAGGVKCWGDNDLGQLGDGSTTNRTTAVDVVGLTSGVADVETFGKHTCALTTAGGVKCWGNNLNGQLGDGTTNQSTEPVDVVGLGSGVAAIATGSYHSCALMNDGSVNCWGYNLWGQLGDGSGVDQATPVAVTGFNDAVTAISAGDEHTCATLNNGAVQCWGRGFNGELGDGTNSYEAVPGSVVALNGTAVDVALGQQFSCALTNASGVQCWGWNAFGQLGDGTNTDRNQPVVVSGLASGAAAVAVGSFSACAITPAGGVTCWGRAPGNSSNVPSPAVGLDSGIVEIGIGSGYLCALTTTAGVKCLGQNDSGQLGNGTLNYGNSPSDVPGFSGGAKLEQSINFASLPDVAASVATLSLMATTSSSLPVTFTSTASAVCTVNANLVTLVAPGICGITASQVGNNIYGPAQPVARFFLVTAGLIAQSITGFAPASPLSFIAGSTFGLTANGGASGNPVVFASTTPAVCTVSGSVATMVGAGNCVLTADQAGNATYAIAPEATATVILNAASLTQQAITGFAPASPLSFIAGSTFGLTANGGASGNPVAFASTTPAVCTVSGSIVTMVSAGNCVLTADQTGNATYAAAPEVTVTVVINAASITPQTITGFAPASPVAFTAGGTFTLSATGGGSGNPLVFDSTTPLVCTVSGNVVTMVSVGSCVLTVDQAGNNSYSAAQEVTATVALAAGAPGSQAILGFAPATPIPFAAGGFFGLSAMGGGSGNPIVFGTTTSAICAVSGNVVTMISPGDCVLTADQAGNGSYSAATQVTATVTFVASGPTITFGPLADKQLSDPPFMITASANNGLPVTFGTSTQNICVVSSDGNGGGMVVIVSAGTCTINAVQFVANGAPAVSQSFTVAGVTLPNHSASSFALGGGHACAVTESGSVKCWGENDAGQVGDGTTTNRLFAVDVSGLSTGVAIVVAGGLSSCALTTAGGVKCWGDNSVGELGDGTNVQRNMPVDVMGLTGGVTALASGGEHYCAIISDGSVVCWGGNGFGQLGDGSGQNQSTPVPVIGLIGPVQALAAGSNHTCALLVSGAVQCWGWGAFGQLGDGVSLTEGTPNIISSLNGAVTSLALGGESSCAITTSGGAKCWGFNISGQLGDGTNTNSSVPIDVVGLGTTLAKLTVSNRTCAVTTAGGVKCWPYASSLSPADVPGLTSGIADIKISQGGAFYCVLATVGGLECAGANDMGQLGAGTVSGGFFTVTVPANVLGFGGGSKLEQSIIFGQPANLTVGTAGATLNASASSGLLVTFSNSTPTVCSLVGNAVAPLTLGTCTITADQAGNAAYNAAPSVAQSFSVIPPGAQIITGFSPASPLVYAVGATFTLSATGGASGNPVVFSSNTPAVCTVMGSAASVLTAGTCTLVANQAGNANYAAAATVTATVIISKAGQTISFGTLVSQTLPVTPFGLFASATSLLAVTFSSTTQAVCTVSGNTVTVASAGTCIITANQAGDGNFNAAPQVTQSFPVLPGAGPALQSIVIAPIASQLQGTTVTLSATATSGLAVTFSSTTPAICTVSGNVATLTAAGTCTIAADQAGNSSYVAAATATQSFTVYPTGTQLPQTITGLTLPSVVLVSAGSIPLNLQGGGSGNPVVLASTTPFVCSTVGNVVYIIDHGSCGLVANQAGSALYAAAPQVSTSALVQADQSVVPIITSGFTPSTVNIGRPALWTITITNPGNFRMNGVELDTTLPSGLSVAASNFTTNGAANFSAATTCDYGAEISGSNGGSSHPLVQAGDTVLTMTGIQIQPGATCSIEMNLVSGAYHSYTVDLPVVITSNAKIISTGPSANLTVAPGAPLYTAQTITFTPASPFSTASGPTFTISATGGGSGNPVTFTSLSPGVCTLSGNVVTVVNGGICTIAADQAGDGSHSPAARVSADIFINVVPLNQSIQFTGPASASLGSAVVLSATASSNLLVSFNSLTPSVCTVSGGAVSLLIQGVCTIAANQPGNQLYLPAQQVTQSFPVIVAPPALVTPLLPDAYVGLPYNASLVLAARPALSSSSISGISQIPLTYLSNGAGLLTLMGTPVVAGTYTLTASANNQYASLDAPVPLRVQTPAGSPASISVSVRNTCAVQNGGVYCWGQDSQGQPLQGYQIPPGSGASKVSDGCAIVAGGVQCQGSYQDTSGNSYAYPAWTPILPVGSGATDLSSIDGEGCAVVAGGVQCWGGVSPGVHIDVTTLPDEVLLPPIQVVPAGSGATAIAVGASQSCAVIGSSISCWGWNRFNELNVSGGEFFWTPQPSLQAAGSITSIAIGGYGEGGSGGGFTCAAINGGVQCWGANNSSYWPLGAPSGNAIRSVLPAGSGATAVSAGLNHVCAVVGTALECWGANGAGQFGDGGQVPYTYASPLPITTAIFPGFPAGGIVSAVAAGGDSTCAVVNDILTCWGDNTNGQLGNAVTTNNPAPVAVATTGGVSAIATSGATSCAITAGALQCWGNNGLLASATATSSSTPIPIPALNGGVTAIAMSSHACAIVNGVVMCWGDNVTDELGYATANGLPNPLPGLATGVPGTPTAVAVGDLHSCALSNGNVVCWGDNSKGQVRGLASSSPIQVAISVPGLNAGVTAIAAGSNNTCALANGGVQCWGDNSRGQLGNGIVAPAMAPVQTIPVGSNVSAIAVGGGACAILSGGVQCWGGAGGINTHQPTSVFPAGSGATAITVGSSHACAVIDGGVQCWGFNGSGQLGNATYASSASPVQTIGAGSGVTAISAGTDTTCAILSGATVCWGDNRSGAVGVDYTYSLTKLIPTINASISVPDAPTLTAVTTGTLGVLSLTFVPPANNGGSPITAYTGLCTAAGQLPSSATVQVNTQQPNPTSVTINGLFGNVSFTCVVAATNAAGTGRASNSLSAIPRSPLSISITAPTDGAVVSAGSSVAITVNAAAPLTGMSRLDVYDGNILVTSTTSGLGGLLGTTQTFTLANVTLGLHTLTAKLTDDSGHTLTSAPVTVQAVSSMTTASLYVAGNYFLAPASVDLTAAFTTAGTSSVQKVEFYSNNGSGNTLLTTLMGPPYSYRWLNVPAGNYTLTVKVTDTNNGTATSAPVQITVGTMLSITFDSGFDGTTVNNGTILLTGTVNAPPNSSVKVNGVKATVDANGAFSVNDFPLQTGPNSVTATVSTANGLTSSQTVNITLSGAAPPPSFSVTLDSSQGIIADGGQLTVKVDIESLDGSTFGNISLNCGGGLQNPVVTALGAYPCIYTAPGKYPINITIRDAMNIVVYTNTKYYVAKSAYSHLMRIQAVYLDMMGSLGAGDSAGALAQFVDYRQPAFSNIFAALGGNLASIVPQFGQIISVSAGDDFAEIILMRGTDPNDPNARCYPIQLVVGSDGIWRIESM